MKRKLSVKFMYIKASSEIWHTGTHLQIVKSKFLFKDVRCVSSSREGAHGC